MSPGVMASESCRPSFSSGSVLENESAASVDNDH